jgi:uncharacterized protein
MSSIVLSLDQFLHQPLVDQVRFPPASLELDDPDFKFSRDITGEIKFSMVGEDVMATGVLKTQAETSCVRCLKPVSVELSIDVSEVWLSEDELVVEQDKGHEPGPLHRVLDGETLELKYVYRELVMSELPDRPYCREDCRGLCPGCGQNLNMAECRCGGPKQGADDGANLPAWKKALKNMDVES